jgi:DNA-binding GntR family transcriptional regulator
MLNSQPSQLRPLDAKNLSDHIEERLRAAMLNGIFRPGEQLVESRIADQLGVSRAPVREALSALEREGVVNHVPRQGYFVVDFTQKDIEEIYSLRLVLEIEALRRAMNRLTEEDLVEMQRILDELGQATRVLDEPDRIVELDVLFHEFICRKADHSRLFSAWHNMNAQTQLFIRLTSRTHYNHPEEPKKFHQRILDAIRDQDPERAVANLSDAHQRAARAFQRLRSSEIGAGS